MKNLGKLAILGAVLAASSSFAFATTITLGSYGATGLAGYAPSVTVSNTEMQYVANDIVATVADIPVTPVLSSISPVNATDLAPGAWNGPLADSSYVGINANAGNASTINPGYGYYEFTTTINSLTMDYYGSLTVMADDTTEVLLINSSGTSTLIPFGALGGDAACADNLPTCTAPDTVNLTLLTGNNTLEFIVEQAGKGPVGGTGDPSGVDFDATLSSIPEPSSLMLLGTGLIGAAGMFFRRRVTA